MLSRLLLSFMLMLAINKATAQQILPLREQSKVIDEILDDRLNNLLPALMKETGIDMWILISEEYNEDPVLKTMLPAEWLSARRTTMLVFYQNEKTKSFEKLAVARYDVGASIKSAWDTKNFPINGML